MSTTNRRTIANNVDLSMRVLKHRYEYLVAYGENATNDLRVAYNIYNQMMNMYKLFRKVPAYSDEPGAAALSCAVNKAVEKDMQEIENILFRFYGIRYLPVRDEGLFGWYRTNEDSLIPRDNQPEIIRSIPILYIENEQGDND